MTAPLPLFDFTDSRAELKRLQERRAALLQRLQHVRPGSHQKWKLELQLSAITAEMLKREMRCYPGKRS